MTPRRRATAARRLSLIGLVAAGAAGAAGCSDPEGAVPAWCAAGTGDAVVRFGRVSRPLELREAWRRGGLREGEALVDPEEPAIDRAGRVALIDRALEEIVVIGEDATWIGPVLTQGDGPEEVGLPVAVAWSPQGELLVADFQRRQISRRSLSGGALVEASPVPAGVLEWVYRTGEVHWGWFSLAPNGDVLLDRRSRAEPEAAVVVQLERHAASASRDAQVLLRGDVEPLTARRTLLAPGFPRPLGAIGPGGVVAVSGDSERYRVRILSAGGTDSVVVCRDTPAVPLSRAERGDTVPSGDGPRRAELDELRGWLDDAPRPTSPMPMGRLFFGSTGRLWVERDRSNPFVLGPPSGSAYDVFGEGGAYVGTVQAPPGVTLYGESEAWVIGYEVGSFDETSVVAFELHPVRD